VGSPLIFFSGSRRAAWIILARVRLCAG